MRTQIIGCGISLVTTKVFVVLVSKYRENNQAWPLSKLYVGTGCTGSGSTFVNILRMMGLKCVIEALYKTRSLEAIRQTGFGMFYPGSHRLFVYNKQSKPLKKQRSKFLQSHE